MSIFINFIIRNIDFIRFSPSSIDTCESQFARMYIDEFTHMGPINEIYLPWAKDIYQEKPLMWKWKISCAYENSFN